MDTLRQSRRIKVTLRLLRIAPLTIPVRTRQMAKGKEELQVLRGTVRPKGSRWPIPELMDNLQQFLLPYPDVLRWQLASSRLRNKVSNILRKNCCCANTKFEWNPGSDISNLVIRWTWSSTPGIMPCLKTLPGIFTAASKLFSLRPCGRLFPSGDFRIAIFMNFLLLFTGQNINKHLSFSHGP